MKLLRVGEKGNEKPAILDGDNVIRDLSSNADLYSKSNFFISLLYTPFKI